MVVVVIPTMVKTGSDAINTLVVVVVVRVGSILHKGGGGSGIVLVKFDNNGKTIPKVTGASFDSTNVTFTVQGSSNITNIKYTINGGSEQTTPVGTLAVAHGLSASASITVVAYAVDANGDQISTKKTVTGTIP
jgi:hypothetical protein